MMKRIIAFACAALLGVMPVMPVHAAEWKEGLSAAQPYSGVPAVDLNQTMGYTMLFPRAKMPAQHFCDVIEMYLPREDIERGEGSITLFDEDGEVFKADFTDETAVEIRPLEEVELEGLMWGGGTCVSLHLPVSMTIGKSYYVHMDEGCFTASGGQVLSLAISGNDAWVPVLTGDFGVNALRYLKGTGEEAAEGTAEEDTLNGEITTAPVKGDKVVFDLLLGGPAVTAVLYSENGSVQFPTMEYKESGEVAGTIIGDELSWGLVFLNDAGDVLDLLAVNR
ncbi:MAG: hypothetical protein IIY55_02865 [Blautia sp.]|nr:hypothetical protein [Blautia sp.]